MSLASADLPSDPDALRAFALACQSELATATAELQAAKLAIQVRTLEIEKLKFQIAKRGGAGGAIVRRQSIASTSNANCAGVNVNVPSTIGGQTNLWRSRRLANRHIPLPSQYRPFR